ncbi:MAG: hypothetical protein BMS9Abin05_2286 [Rhodothermia bacterium]|nr:MAG: hypothetical protein BMS9Abin05_2286 [Rhodothermia bacterium]
MSTNIDLGEYRPWVGGYKYYAECSADMFDFQFDHTRTNIGEIFEAGWPVSELDRLELHRDSFPYLSWKLSKVLLRRT